ncbi:DUF2268 domain-containing protein [Bacillus sp. UMB0893]|uniref:DUF2268 domain-containing protein n=1 Tax=Bacillus sp. UMB0893 TaxID=2066053 RepID=UPI002153374B|nr:DUF2268 domain-containing protein [Bacillus sp. UMB0893]
MANSMTVMNTNEWLDQTADYLKVCERLVPFFNKNKPEEISKYLHAFGMYKRESTGKEIFEKLKKKNVWEFVKKDEAVLKKKWNGPNVPIFILPADAENRKMKYEFGGKSGLAFHDKLFLFLSENSNKEIQTILTHEYHHVCRLAKDPKKEEDYTLIDAIILEGLAENAVRERMGEELVGSWTKRYSKEQIHQLYNNIIEPNQDLKSDSKKFSQLMFGTGFYPKMLGYAVGYQLVKYYMEITNSNITDLFSVPSEEIVKKSSIKPN